MTPGTDNIKAPALCNPIKFNKIYSGSGGNCKIFYILPEFSDDSGFLENFGPVCKDIRKPSYTGAVSGSKSHHIFSEIYRIQSIYSNY